MEVPFPGKGVEMTHMLVVGVMTHAPAFYRDVGGQPVADTAPPVLVPPAEAPSCSLYPALLACFCAWACVNCAATATA